MDIYVSRRKEYAVLIEIYVIKMGEVKYKG